jgi:aminopeptidase
MSSSTTHPDAFVFPLHPNAPNAQSPVSNASLDPSTLWASARTGNSTKALDSRVVYTPQGPVATLVSLGPKEEFEKKDGDAKREVVRKAAGVGIGGVKNVAISAGVKTVQVDGSIDGHAAGA